MTDIHLRHSKGKKRVQNKQTNKQKNKTKQRQQQQQKLQEVKLTSPPT